jgi:hypothetical protein
MVRPWLASLHRRGGGNPAAWQIGRWLLGFCDILTQPNERYPATSPDRDARSLAARIGASAIFLRWRIAASVTILQHGEPSKPSRWRALPQRLPKA